MSDPQPQGRSYSPRSVNPSSSSSHGAVIAPAIGQPVATATAVAAPVAGEAAATPGVAVATVAGPPPLPGVAVGPGVTMAVATAVGTPAIAVGTPAMGVELQTFGAPAARVP